MTWRKRHLVGYGSERSESRWTPSSQHVSRGASATPRARRKEIVWCSKCRNVRFITEDETCATEKWCSVLVKHASNIEIYNIHDICNFPPNHFPFITFVPLTQPFPVSSSESNSLILQNILTGISWMPFLSFSVVSINCFAIFRYPSWPRCWRVAQAAAMLPP